MDKLALFGGGKAVTLDYEKIANRPLVNPKGLEDAIALIKKGEISQSSTVPAFEKKFAAYIGAAYGVATCNGTSALHTALYAVGVGLGDEVIVPSFTFWATLGPVYCQHATPVFCDVDAATQCIDPADVEKRITPKTKAIMAVHVWGAPCNMDAIMAVAKKHNLKVIEDCSHAHGATWNGTKVGTFGDVGCYSLQGSKPLPAGEGGVLVTNNRAYYERALAFGQYDRLAELGEDSAYRQYMLTGMGYKFRPHPVGIAFANANLDELDERNAIRAKNAELLVNLVADIPWLKQQAIYPEARRVYSYHYMYFDNAKLENVRTFALLKALAAEGVSCGYCGYGRLHQSPLAMQGGPEGDCGKRATPVSLPVTEHLAHQAFLAAPRFENDCPDLIKQYAEAFHKVEANCGALIDFDKGSDFTAEMKNLSGRTIAMIQ